MVERAEIVVIGAGAAGLFAAVWAARRLREMGRDLGGAGRVVALDGAKRLGAKILVAGGGRCNVTHHAVDETAYAGASRNAIRNVLRRFDVARTVEFFGELGVELKREETGKLFPTTDDAHTVLDALLRAVRENGAEVVHPWRVGGVRRKGEGFVIEREREAGHSALGVRRSGETSAESQMTDSVFAKRLILATGGMALPKSGSDGKGYEFARALGHSVTPVWAALVPLVLNDEAKWIKALSGLTLEATLDLWSGTGKKLVSFTNSTLCTHFGLSGPSVLDVSRYYTAARRGDPAAKLTINWMPGVSFDGADAWLAERPQVVVWKRLGERVPERLARALCESAGIDPAGLVGNLKRDDRRGLARQATSTVLPINGDRGFTYAEVTAGGVPLSEVHLETMESRVCPGLHLCGEILDVDGRIGGFNFQWAWASGFVAGNGAMQALIG